MDDSEFDIMLRSALMDAIRLEWAQELEGTQPEHQFSARYLREREKLLKDPFGYARRKTRPMWKKAVHLAASILLVVSIGLGGILAISPEARAWVVKQLSVFWGDRSAVFTIPEHQDGLVDISHYRPTCIPDGFEIVAEIDDSDVSLGLTYRNMAGNYICFDSASSSDSVGFSFILDNEHSERQDVEVNGCPGTLMAANEAGWPSHLIWMDQELGISYCITSDLDYEELLQIAESVNYVK